MRRARGAGLPELLVVLAIGLMLAAVSAPGLASLLARRALVEAAGDLYDSVNFTRAEAMARGARVVLAAPAGGGLAHGWIVFVDADGDGRQGGDEPVLQRHAALAPGIEVAARFSPAGNAYVAYNGAGRSCSTSSSAAARPGTLMLTRAGLRRRITIAMLGRARICDPGRDAGCAD